MIWRPRYFSRAEMTVTSTGLDNDPTPHEWANLETLCMELLDPMRERLGEPVHITSGFRGEQVNEAVGGSQTSQHRFGLAVDFHLTTPSLDNMGRIVRACRGLPVDQLIFYAPDRSSHVHIGYGDRGDLLFAEVDGGYTRLVLG